MAPVFSFNGVVFWGGDGITYMHIGYVARPHIRLHNSN